MSLVCSLIILIIVLLCIISRKEKLSEDIDTSFITIHFYKTGKYLYKAIFIKKDIQGQYFQNLYDAHRILNPFKQTSDEIEIYFIKKLGTSLLILFFGVIFVLIFQIKNDGNQYLEKDGISIERNGYLEDEEKIILDAYVDNSEIKDVQVVVGNRKYTDEQLLEMLPEFEALLEAEILKNNESADHVNNDLSFVSEIEGYPFEVIYKWEDKELINRDGRISAIEEGSQIVKIEAIISYMDFKASYEFSIVICPKDYSYYELLEKKLLDSVREDENQSSEYYHLPGIVDGMEVRWSEKKKNNTIIFLLVVVIVAIFVFLGRDKDIFDQVDKRSEQMIEDYPEIVSKLTLLISAGMSLRSAWKKMVMDYVQKIKEDGTKRRYAYEEMVYTFYEMESGVEETICFQNFSKRCKVQKYIKLATLLDQSLKLGAKGFTEELKKESRDAFEEKKSIAEKKGEEAGTKLLLPMMLMMIVVMVVIMVPAFMGI